jgi:hypothetical protein
MRNWSTKRRVSFAVHAIYVLIPAVAAIIAALRLWDELFGSMWVAIPLILCVEGIALIGFVFKLMRVESPFVPARHFVPAFSLLTLSYELGRFLVERNGWEVGLGVTALVVAVFGTLFVKSFGVIEGLVIDPVTAAEEKAREQAGAIMVQVAEHSARAAVFRRFTEQLREAEQLTDGRPKAPGSHRNGNVLEGEQGDPFGLLR